MDQNKIQNELQLFYRILFKSNCTKSYDDYIKFLDKIITPVLTTEKAIISEGDLAERELLKGALSGLRQFLATESPLKMMKKAFYFTSEALFVLKIFKFLS